EASHLPKTASRPARTSLSFARDSLLTRSLRSALSTEIICDVFAIDSLGRFVISDDRSTLPGTLTQFVFVVSGTHTTVPILLRLNASHCTTITGRRKPGPEPTGGGRSAHQISPCETTNQFSPICARPPL